VPVTHLDCTRCNQRYEPGQVLTVCTVDGAPLFARYDLERAAKNMRPGHLALREPTLWRYDDVLPVESPDHRVSLGEGFTPLLTARRLGSAIGLPRLYIKDESGEPTGSFKARGLSLAVSMAKALGATDVCLPSAGNAGSALAAYAAKGGLKAHVFVPKDIAQLFLMETRAYGAEVETVDGLITDAGKVCAERAKENGWYECATLKEPYRVEGKKTMGYELAEQMGWKLPDAILYPTGGGTGLVGMWKAFAEMETMGFVGPARPRMYAVQAEGCAPVVKAFSDGKNEVEFWPDATTHALGLRVPKPYADALILDAIRQSHGSALAVSEEEIMAGVREAASFEGLFMAPEGGACVAALRKLRASGHLSADDTVVVFNTGTGLKYTDVMAPLFKR
jgi:threonine synthase